MLNKKALEKLKQNPGSFVEITFPKLLDHVKLGEDGQLYLKQKEFKERQKIIDIEYEEIKEKQLLLNPKIMTKAEQKIQVDKWIDTKGNKVSRSSEHDGIWIVEADGGWFSIASSQHSMELRHPIKHILK